MNELPKVLIVGAGNIGKLLAVLFSRAGYEVDVLIRPSQTDWFMTKDRLTIQWPGHDSRFDRGTTWTSNNIHFATDLARFKFDNRRILVMAVRSFDLVGSLKTILGYIPLRDQLQTIVIPTNGIGHDRDVQHVAYMRCGSGVNVLAASITFPCESDPADNKVVRVTNSKAGIAMAPFGTSDENIALHIAKNLQGLSRIDVSLLKNTSVIRWSKLLLNVCGNAIPAILNVGVDKAYQSLRMCRLELAMIGEILATMRMVDIKLVDLPGYPLTKMAPLYNLAWLERLIGWTDVPAILYQKFVLPKILKGRGGKDPSFLIEFRRGSQRCENYHDQLFTNGASVIDCRANMTLAYALNEQFALSGDRTNLGMTPQALWKKYCYERDLFKRIGIQ